MAALQHAPVFGREEGLVNPRAVAIEHLQPGSSRAVHRVGNGFSFAEPPSLPGAKCFLEREFREGFLEKSQRRTKDIEGHKRPHTVWRRMLGGGERRVKPAIFDSRNMTDAIFAAGDGEIYFQSGTVTRGPLGPDIVRTNSRSTLSTWFMARSTTRKRSSLSSNIADFPIS